MKYVIFIDLDKTLFLLKDELKINLSDLKEIVNAQNLDVEIVFFTNENNLNKLKNLSNIINTKYAIYGGGKFIWGFEYNKNVFEEKHSNISNETTIDTFCQEQGISLENAMSIGITKNDFPNFEKIGFSYAMANSENDFKKVSKYHTSSFDQGGLGEAIVDYLYRNKITRK